MVDLSTQYMGLKLRNPLIAGSSGLTFKLDHLKEMGEKGIGAVVLKSIFEEQIEMQAQQLFKQASTAFDYTEAYDYITNYSSLQALDEYLTLIRKAKENLSIPVIASINCYSLSQWVSYVKEIEKAGADGIELNIFILPSLFFNHPFITLKRVDFPDPLGPSIVAKHEQGIEMVISFKTNSLL